MENIIHLNVGGVPEHFNIPWQIALEQEMFAKQGLSATWKEYPGGTGAMAKDLRDNNLDVAVLLTEGIVADISKGNSSRIISLYVSSPLIWGIHVPSKSSIESLNDIKGKRYAISRIGSGSHLMAYVHAKQQGWDVSDDQLVIVGDIEGARKAFKDEEAEVFLWEKFMTKPLVDSGEFRRVGECPTPWPCFVIAAREEVINKNPEALKILIDIVNQTSTNFKKNEKAAELTSLKFNLELEDAQLWHQQTNWDCGTPLSKKDYENVVNNLFDLQLITTKPAYEEVCTNIS